MNNFEARPKHEFACNVGKVTEYEVKSILILLWLVCVDSQKKLRLPNGAIKNLHLTSERGGYLKGTDCNIRCVVITLSKDELIKLREILNSIDVNCIDEYMSKDCEV